MRDPFQSSGVNDPKRFEEIDMLRGVAILMMILFHTLFDLSFFGIYPVNITFGFWRYFAFATACLFLLIAGISITVSHARTLSTFKGDPNHLSGWLWTKYLRRGFFIFGCGLLVTAVTWLYLGENLVIFGILHLIGISIMVAPLFFRFTKKNILIGGLFISIGIALAHSGINGPMYLLWLGIHPASLTSVDYTPLFPWLGVFLVGMGAGVFLYPGGKRSWSPPRIPVPVSSALALLGRHSLLIYMVHQPLILVLLQIITGTPVLV